jgi:hypothetical protein
MALVDVLLSLATNVYSVLLRGYCHCFAPPSKDFDSFQRSDMKHRLFAAVILTISIVFVDKFFLFPTAWALTTAQGARLNLVSKSDLNNKKQTVF